MKGLRNKTWPLKTRPSLLACVLAMRQERRAYDANTVMAAYEQAVAMLEAEQGIGVRPIPAPAPVENVRPLLVTSIDNVEDDGDCDADDPVEVTYGISEPERVAGEETGEEPDEAEVALEAAGEFDQIARDDGE
jgi:hypothetical protein